MTSQTVTRQLKLHSPTGSEPAIFTWPNDEQTESSASGTSFGEEIVQTIRIVFEDYPELYQENLALDRCDTNNFMKVKELTERFNKIMDTYVKLNRGTEAFCARLEQRATPKLFRHLLNQIYNRAVTNPQKLRDYEPFSPSVYGETSPELLDSILKMLNLTEDDCFVDLGSGVGNVVLQVAALANCKSVYGIEYESIPASYASAMSEEFRFWMRWYGKCYSDFVLEQGDFLQNPQIDERIREADVIFVNNYAFGSTVNHELKMKFIHMKDGARIVSSREFCPETFRLNNRTKNDLGAVMQVKKPEEFLGKVSWSDKSVQYYLQMIDHRKLAHYYEKVNNRRLKHQNSKNTEDENSSSSSETSSSHRSVRKPIKRKHRSSTVDLEISVPQNRPATPVVRDSSPIDDDRRSLLLIDSYLESFRNRLKNYFYYMKSNIYREHIEKQLNEEKELNQQLKGKVNFLENNVKTLLEDAIRLLRLRTQELGIEKLDQPEQLLTFANQISSKHKDLRIKIAVLEKEIADYDYENDQINIVLSKIAANDTHFTIPTGIHQDIVTTRTPVTFRGRPEQFERSQPTSNRWDRNVTTKTSSEQSSHSIKNRSATEVGSKIKISLTELGSYESLLSTKALEPVQVHSIISSGDTLNKHGRATMKSKLDDELLTSDDSLGQSPRKKRDFYGKTAETDLKSSPNIPKDDSPVSNPT